MRDLPFIPPPPGLAQIAAPTPRWADRWHQLEAMLSAYAGDWVRREPFPGVTWFQLVSVGLILLGTLVTGILVRYRATREITQPALTAPLPGTTTPGANALPVAQPS